MLALPVGGLGFVLGAIGLALALGLKRPGLAASIVGTGLSLLAIVMAFFVTGRATKAVSEALKEDAPPMPIATAVPSANERAGATNAVAPQAKPLPDASKPAPPQRPPEPDWVLAPNPARLGDIEVRIISARVGKVSLKDATGESESKDALLSLTLEVANMKPNEDLKHPLTTNRAEIARYCSSRSSPPGRYPRRPRTFTAWRGRRQLAPARPRGHVGRMGRMGRSETKDGAGSRSGIRLLDRGRGLFR
jgi:hypothetical protein